MLKMPFALSSANIIVGARASALSRMQVKEVECELKVFHPEVHFVPLWMTTKGDQDLITSLKTLDKTDFFTQEIDHSLLHHRIQAAIHSAKDLPDPLPYGLFIAAITRGLTPSDSLVLREKETWDGLPSGAFIGTSSQRREKTIYGLRPDLKCVDVRGTIEQRLTLLHQKKVDGLVVAECALLRLQLTQLNRFTLPGITAPLQGRLAVVIREEDTYLKELFACIDTR